MDAPIVIAILAIIGMYGVSLVALAFWDEWRRPATTYTLGHWR